MSILVAIISALFLFALVRQSCRPKRWQERALPWMMTAPPNNDFLPGHFTSGQPDATETRAHESHGPQDYGSSCESDASPNCDSYDGGGGSFDNVSGGAE